MDDRQPIQLGVDLRPLPLQMPGEDTIWLFDPDPGKSFFLRIAEAQKLLTSVEEDPDSYGTAFDTLTDAIAQGLVQKTQRAAFVKREYGLKSLTQILQELMKDVADLPTPPSSPSGKTQRRGGGR